MKIYIWNANLNSTQVGHAALTLNDGTHISWWPTGICEGKNCKKTPQDIGSLAEDTELEGGEPDKTFALYELDEKAIKTWWEAFLSSGKTYHLATRNCCHIVMGALRAGGFRCASTFWELVFKVYCSVIPGILSPGDVEAIIRRGAGVSDIS